MFHITHTQRSDNIKLATVTSSDWDVLHKIGRKFFIPEEKEVSTSIPEWYDPENLTLRFESWSRCSREYREKLFKRFMGKKQTYSIEYIYGI